MRIAQIAPLQVSVPPHTYGGTERVIANLTDALVRLGHDVTLFATGDSQHDGAAGRAAPDRHQFRPDGGWHRAASGAAQRGL